MKRRRVTSKKAKLALELLAKKKIGAKHVSIELRPAFGLDYASIYDVVVDVAWNDWRGYISKLYEEDVVLATQQYSAHEYLQRGNSYATLLRTMKNRSANGHTRYNLAVAGCVLFDSSDSIEEALIEVDLAGNVEDAQD